MTISRAFSISRVDTVIPRGGNLTNINTTAKVVIDLIGMSLDEVILVQRAFFSLLYFYMSIQSHFEIVDYIYDLKQIHKNFIGK